ncbi:MAG: haloacid dehalogenase-like hydrolase [Candidatus Moraniibacteriota bacterium]
MEIKAVLIDFDGTLVTRSMLDWLCGLVGKENESRLIGIDHAKGLSPGLEPLVKRINLLKGLSIKEIESALKADLFLRKGSKEFFSFLQRNHIISILHSGNIVPLLKYYQKKLKIEYAIGSDVIIRSGVISHITTNSYSGLDYKLLDSKKILKKLKINSKEVVALGDSPSDKTIFQFSNKSIAVNPRFGIEKYADYIVKDDLKEAIAILKYLKKTP